MATPENPATVFLINQYSGHGHLDTYARLYSASFLALGYRIVLIAEKEAGIGNYLAARGGDMSKSFAFLARSELHEPAATSRRQIRAVWQQEGLAALSLRIGRKIVSSVLNRVEGSAIVPAVLAKRLRAWAAAVPFTTIVDEVRIASRRLQHPPDLVFFLYLDMMSESAIDCRALTRKLEAPWGGILFHPRARGGDVDSHIERYFLCPNAKGALLLNPHLVEPYGRALPRLTFHAAPDVTESATLAADSSPLLRELAARARGRTIVLQFGTLSPHKRIEDLIEVIRRADPDRYLFAIIGEIFWDAYGGDRSLQAFLDHPPEHAFVRLGFIAEEGELNALIAASDILYAVYADFPDSSNNLTKAAIFEKPLIVADDHLMGERVRQYRLGAAVKARDPTSILAGLEALHGRPKSDFGFAAFRDDHSETALRATLTAAMTSWLR